MMRGTYPRLAIGLANAETSWPTRGYGSSGDDQYEEIGSLSSIVVVVFFFFFIMIFRHDVFGPALLAYS